MRTTFRPIILVAAGLLAMLPAVGYAGTGISGIERPIVVKPGQQFDPHTSLTGVSFTDTSSGDADIWYWDPITRNRHPVATGPGDQILSDISGLSIAYVDRVSGLGDIKLFNILTGATTTLTATPHLDETDPTVSGRLVAWVVNGTTADVVVHDRLLGTNLTIDGPGNQLEPEASGALLAYVDSAGLTTAIRVYDANTGTTTTVYTGMAFEPDIDGSHVAFTLVGPFGSDIAIYDTSGTALSTLSLAGDQGSPHISGEWISFEDYSTGIAHVGLWHWTTGDVFYPAPSASSQQVNDLSWGRLVYTDDRSGDLDIYAYESPDLLSTAGGQLQAAGCVDNAGIANSLIAKLSAAQSAINAGDIKTAINILTAFINQVQAQSGKHILASCTVDGVTTDPAAVLIADAQSIITGLTVNATPDPITGSVGTGTGSAVAGATLTLVDSAGTTLATATTDITGFYYFATTGLLTPGATYSVSVTGLPTGFTSAAPVGETFTWAGSTVPLSNFTLT